jgi:hypothetical protein
VSIAVPLTPLLEAVMVEVPAATPVARPEPLMVAQDVFDDVQVTEFVMFFVVPSL